MSKNPTSPYLLQAPDLQWSDDGVPQSAHFGDVYFSRSDGLDETRHVFLHNNQLAERWRQLPAATDGTFTIAETGFGTGLNFLAAWQLWRELAPPHYRLHFVSVEKFPLTREQITTALAPWPELAEPGEQLLKAYPPLLRGSHRLCFDNVTLDLIFADAIEGLRELLDTSHPQQVAQQGAKVDAWFLDGFAPASNPEMWSDELFQLMALNSRPGSSFATFTAAGFVRRGLAAQGFAVRKMPGWGSKREMLAGQLESATNCNLDKPDRQAWHTPPLLQKRERIAIIGAGLAGAHSALALAKRGCEVTVIDSAATPATAASGNPQGILYTKLSPKAGQLNRFTLASFLFAQRHYRPWLDTLGEQIGATSGLIQLMRSDRELAMLEELKNSFAGQEEWLQFVDAGAASQLAGVALEHPGVYLPQAGWLRPQQVCQQALAHSNIRFQGSTRVEKLQRADDHWQLLDSRDNIISSTDVVIIANSHSANTLAQCEWLPLKPIRGQLSLVDAGSVSATPRVVLCHEGYTAPPLDGSLTLGATFDMGDTTTDIRDSDHQRNLEQLNTAIPGLLGEQPEVIGGRAALRCASPDYAPIVGALPDYHAFTGQYAELHKNAKTNIAAPAPYLPGLYVNVAHGSRGLSSTPLCAELLAALVCNEIRPLPAELVKSLSPARFLIRDLIRNRL